jgi:hypothetical protein
VTTLPLTVVTLYPSVPQWVAARVTRVTTLLILLNFLRKWRDGRRAWFISIAERERKQPIGVVTVVTLDVTPLQDRWIEGDDSSGGGRHGIVTRWNWSRHQAQWSRHPVEGSCGTAATDSHIVCIPVAFEINE